MNDTLVRAEQDLIDLGRSINTRRSYLGALRRLQQWHGTPLDELGPEDLQQYMRHLVRTNPGGHATHTMFGRPLLLRPHAEAAGDCLRPQAPPRQGQDPRGHDG